MSVARWTLRLPRTAEHIVGKRTTRQAIRRVEQRRWIQKPPPRPRPWAGKPENHKDDSKKQIQQPQESQPQDAQTQQPGRNAQLATTLAESDTSDLLAEVHIPDDPHSVLPREHPALSLLGNSSLVIQRQLEMMNV
ncbi:hypothetical protein LTR56_016948 [Elasticomyces elasticus]|nr:hypothetical protein LTR56_016948 [Elasticomyces elasticus]